MIEQKIKTLDKESLKEIISEMAGFLSEEQYKKLELIIDNCIQKGPKAETAETAETVIRMSQDFIDEKMEEIFSCMEEIDEGELYLGEEEYEDYSSGYWDAEWYTEYYDSQGIGEILSSMIQFAKDCVDDRRYQEANHIYEWLWEMSVSVDSEYEDSPVDLDTMVEKKLVHTDLKQLALLTLYTEYQVQEPKERAENLFQYFHRPAFRKLHMEEMFYVGRENLTETEQFWRDWISLLKTKSGGTENRLLKEAVLYKDGIDGLVKMADEMGDVHPTLYLAAMEAYEKNHDYVLVEEIGRRAMDRIDGSLTIRSEIALKAAYSASYLNHMESVMLFCWECFRSDPTDRNFLRLFGTKEMA